MVRRERDFRNVPSSRRRRFSMLAVVGRQGSLMACWDLIRPSKVR